MATGKDGRLTKADVLGAIEKGVTVPVAQTTAASAHVAPRVADNREERVPMSRLRRLIASRLKEAQNTAAMLTTFNEVDKSDVMALRSEYKEEEKTHGARLGFMGFFVKAVISALREYPAVNAEISGDDIIYKNFYNIGVAVGTPQGLVVPVVKDAQTHLWRKLKPQLMILAAVRVMAARPVRQICLAAALRFPMAGFMDR